MGDELKVLRLARGAIRGSLTRFKNENTLVGPNVLDDKLERLVELDKKIAELLAADSETKEDVWMEEWTSAEHYRELCLELKDSFEYFHPPGATSKAADQKDIQDNQKEEKLKDQTEEEEEEHPDEKPAKKATIKKKKSKRDKSPAVDTEDEALDSSSGTDSDDHHHKARTRLDLPKWKLPSYDGSIENFIDFWGQFEKIHDDKKIKRVDKLRYLKQAVTGRAKRLLDAYPTSKQNYAKAIEAFKKRFGKEDRLIDFYTRELIDLVAKRLRSGEVDLTKFYDKLIACVNNLESLGLAAHKHSCIIVPLIEQTLPVNVLRDWEKEKREKEKGLKGFASDSRLNLSQDTDSSDQDQLTELLCFMERLVDTEESVNNANRQTGSGRGKDSRPRAGGRDDTRQGVDEQAGNGPETARDMANVTRSTGRFISNCIFCNGKSHFSQDCIKAQDMTLEERRKLIQTNKACYQCLRPGHPARDCRTTVRCIHCHKAHFVILCSEIDRGKKENVSQSKEKEVGCEEPKQSKENAKRSNESQKPYVGAKGVAKIEKTHSHFTGFTGQMESILQTVKADLLCSGSNSFRTIRVFLDSGSSRSYIVTATAREVGLQKISDIKMIHQLFGGIETRKILHGVFHATLRNVHDHDEAVDFYLLGQHRICTQVGRIENQEVLSILEDHNIFLSDDGLVDPEIQIMLGVDYIPRILTGEMIKISDELTATNTVFGWTLMGKFVQDENSFDFFNLQNLPKSVSMHNFGIEDFWELETMGIRDTAHQKQRNTADQEMLEEFQDNVTINSEGRYEIKLPFQEDYESLTDNFLSAKNRLTVTTRKLIAADRYGDYDQVLREWESEGIITEVPFSRGGHFLPHRPVFKESSATTKIRPVFDASNKDINGRSLNDFLKKGPNLIELIPKMLFLFRANPIGITADVRKAFLQISIRPEDRIYLKFLWWGDTPDSYKVYEHNRVVFGLKCSPFLLAATIDFHLKSYPLAGMHFYVDNLLTSLRDSNDVDEFIRESSEIMDKAKMELREWAYTDQKHVTSSDVKVLGLNWQTDTDLLSCPITITNSQDFSGPLTKRKLLSVTQSIFDPIGITSPVTILPKTLLRETWEQKYGWDQRVPPDIEESFKKWVSELHIIPLCQIDRSLFQTDSDEKTLHIFMDGSKSAYAACIFVRSEDGATGQVDIRLVLAKSRITPAKLVSNNLDPALTIPRIELMGAVLAVRLYVVVKDDPQLGQLRPIFWTDSTAVLCWIRENKLWQPFVANRVKEIQKVTERDQWRHVPGTQNPADLLSRGCTPQYLKESKWWQGPQWLYSPEEEWPEDKSIVNTVAYTVEISCCNAVKPVKPPEHQPRLIDQLKESDTFTEAVRLMGYIYRFYDRKKNFENDCFSETEIQQAEIRVLWLIQRDSFPNTVKKTDFPNLTVIRDENGLFRVKSRLTLLEDEDVNYTYPVLLNGKHELVKKLIWETHLTNRHAGVVTVMVELRKSYWIIKARRNIKQVLADCFRCKRYQVSPFDSAAAPLPVARIQAYSAFQQCGIDCAGPFHIVDFGKVWITLFTCAVFRAIHLEVVQAMTTDSFVFALRRFIARRGRMAQIFSDNGTNFVGCNNKLEVLDWEKIQAEFGLHKITWTFSPARCPWWGGFWERMVGCVKNLLKRNLGSARLNLEEFTTLVTECEGIVNNRPLTYIAEDDNLIPLTPALILNNVQSIHTEDLDAIDHNHLLDNFRSIQRIREAISTRFQKEYIGLLMEQKHKKNHAGNIKVGDIVLVGREQKRMFWPLGRVMQIHLGKDGNARLATVRVKGKEVIEPCKRLYPLEINANDELISILKAPKQPEEKVSVDKKIDTPVDKDVDKTVGKKVDKTVEKKVDKTVEKKVDKKVDKRVDKTVDQNIDDRVDEPVMTRSGRIKKLLARYRD